MSKAVVMGFDQDMLGTLRVKDGVFVVDGPRADNVLLTARGAAEAIAQDNPDRTEDITAEEVMDRLVKTMRGRSWAVYEGEEPGKDSLAALSGGTAGTAPSSSAP